MTTLTSPEYVSVIMAERQHEAERVRLGRIARLAQECRTRSVSGFRRFLPVPRPAGAATC